MTTKELENFIQVGSNAAEYIKIMPGFGISNGTSNIANYNGQTIGINGDGNGGNQSTSGGEEVAMTICYGYIRRKTREK